ncbi:MAG: hypothetical protein CVU56_03315 [Deltaproteobacteria bacterium HGW-Deltaproteobacteria-14]|jgi:hypothetical protein|nr:MAG: hypothetical protein CVU56_03315 [Deltaproteobacteria bacterium HGW-Deltaproteobacteria-14]
MKITLALGFLGASLLLLGACDGGSEADRRGVGASCTNSDDCTEDGQSCLAFKGGYCGVMGCDHDVDCPGGSLCVTHTDAQNYCFLSCDGKADCNRNRAADIEANCSSNATFADGGTGKACVPPSGT